MDFVGFETFSDQGGLPSPQPSLALPLKANIETLSAKLNNLTDFKNLLKQGSNHVKDSSDLLSGVSGQYAEMSIKMINNSHKGSLSTLNETQDIRGNKSDAFSFRMGRALNSSVSDTHIKELFSTLEPKIAINFRSIESGIDGSLARKELRGEIESEIIQINASQLAAYANIVTTSKYLGDRLRALESLIEETNELLARNSQATSNLQTKVSELTSDKATVGLKKALLKSFKMKFALNEYDEHLLSSGEINKDFFGALKRAESIYEACPVLLALENPNFGQKIMTKVSNQISKANLTITSFCNRCLSNADMLLRKERHDILKLCLDQLMQKPDQLASVLDAFVKSRTTALLEDFNSQVGGLGSKIYTETHEESRPVFYSSHDPSRFVTDLLAYVHSSAANESEIISGIFKSEQHFSDAREKIVNRVMSGLVSPIRSSIEQIITLETKLNTIYSIFTILELYLVMFEKDVHAHVITSSIEECMNLIRKKFHMILTSRLSTIQESNSAKFDITDDLQPPEWIVLYYADILPIIDAMRSPTILGVSAEEHKAILNLITDRPIEVFQKHLELVSEKFSKDEMSISQLNFLDLIVSKIIPLSLLGDKMLDVSHKIDGISRNFQEIYFHGLLADCGLADYYNAMNLIRSTEDGTAGITIYSSVSESKIFQKDAILMVDQKVQSIIPTALLDIQSSLMKVNNPVVVSSIISISSRKFVKFYTLFAQVVDEYIAHSLLNWSCDDIARLLGVQVDVD